MTQFQLFDSVELKDAITLPEGQVVLEGTSGAIVEVLQNGDAYMVELFGNWVKPDEQEHLVSADPDDPDAFVETIGVEVVYPQQLRAAQT